MDSRELDELLKSIMRGETRALERLIYGYQAPLLKLGSLLGLDDTQAEEVACAVFLQFHQEAPVAGLRRRPEHGESWLFERYANEVRSRVLRRRRGSLTTVAGGPRCQSGSRFDSPERRV